MDVGVTATGDASPAGLEGEWVVRRVSGLLPPVGLRKRIGVRGGSTRVGPLPVALFRVRGRVLDYRWLPLEDQLTFDGEAWVGRGLFLGREFCRFRLERSSRDADATER